MPDLNDARQNGEGSNAEKKESRSSRHSRRRPTPGDDARSERRAFRGAARRRKLRTRLWLVTAPAVVVIAVVVTLLVVFGGQDSGESAIVVSTTTVPGPAATGTLLIVEQGEDSPVLVLLQRRLSGGVVLAIPGMTMLKAADSFQLVSAIAANGDRDVLATALGDAFGAQVGSVASVTWPELRKVLVAAGGEGLPPSTLSSSEEDAAQVAAAVVPLLRGMGNAKWWEQLPVSGDSSQFRATIATYVAAGGEWIPAAVTGAVVQRGGSAHLTPEADVVKALLTTTSGETAITVEVQNGSGVIGVAEQAMTRLKPLGYGISAAGNSDDFPGVEQTRVEVHPGGTEVGALVRALLGTGAVTESEAVEPGHVLVVLGKDYNPTPSSTSGAGVAGASRIWG